MPPSRDSLTCLPHVPPSRVSSRASLTSFLTCLPNVSYSVPPSRIYSRASLTHITCLPHMPPGLLSPLLVSLSPSLVYLPCCLPCLFSFFLAGLSAQRDLICFKQIYISHLSVLHARLAVSLTFHLSKLSQTCLLLYIACFTVSIVPLTCPCHYPPN